MNSLTRFCMMAIACWALLGPGEVKGGSGGDVTELRYTFNGEYSNKDDKDEDQDLIEGLVAPVNLKCKKSDAVIYNEGSVNGQVTFRQISVLSKEKSGCIKLSRFNFMNVTNSKPKDLNVSTLGNIECADLKGDPDCLAYLCKFAPGIFIGTWTYCGVSGKQRPAYFMILTCNGLYIYSPAGAEAKSTYTPYRLGFTGKRFPVPGASAKDNNPCDN